MKSIFLLLILILLLMYKKKKFSNINYWKKRLKNQNKLLLCIFEDIYNNYLYNINGLFLTSGTLLGCVRDNNIIPFDDDIDLGLYVKNDSEVIEIKNKIKQNFKNNTKYKVTDIFFGLQIVDKYNNNQILDIVFYSKKKDTNIIQFYYLEARLMWPKEYYLSNEINRFKKGKFNNKIYNIPIGSIPFLKRCYGNDCLKIYRYSGLHIGFNSKIIDIFNEQIIYILKFLKLNYIKKIY